MSRLTVRRVISTDPETLWKRVEGGSFAGRWIAPGGGEEEAGEGDGRFEPGGGRGRMARIVARRPVFLQGRGDLGRAGSLGTELLPPRWAFGHPDCGGNEAGAARGRDGALPDGGFRSGERRDRGVAGPRLVVGLDFKTPGARDREARRGVQTTRGRERPGRGRSSGAPRGPALGTGPSGSGAAEAAPARMIQR